MGLLVSVTDKVWNEFTGLYPSLLNDWLLGVLVEALSLTSVVYPKKSPPASCRELQTHSHADDPWLTQWVSNAKVMHVGRRLVWKKKGKRTGGRLSGMIIRVHIIYEIVKKNLSRHSLFLKNVLVLVLFLSWKSYVQSEPQECGFSHIQFS